MGQLNENQKPLKRMLRYHSRTTVWMIAWINAATISDHTVPKKIAAPNSNTALDSWVPRMKIVDTLASWFATAIVSRKEENSQKRMTPPTNVSRHTNLES